MAEKLFKATEGSEFHHQPNQPTSAAAREVKVPKPKFVVYQEEESFIKGLFESHIQKETGVDVKLSFNYDDETQRLYVALEEPVEDERFNRKYHPEECGDFATQLCNEIFAEGKEKCYPQYLSESSDVLEIFVEL